MKSLSKKGSGHLEMVIAFVFFVGFIFFLFIVLNPQSNSSLFGSTIIGVQDNFKEITSVDLAEIFLKANYSSSGKSGKCFNVNFDSEMFVLDFTNAHSLVFDLSGNEVGSSFSGSELSVEPGEEFFRVSISEEFGDDSLAGCKDADSYEIGSTLEREVVSYSKLIDMRDKYYDNYSGLKEELKVPGIFDFAIVPQSLSEATMLPVGGIPGTVDVLVQDRVFEVLNESGVVVNERIGFRIW